MAAGDIETFHLNGTWFNRIEGETSTLGEGYDAREDAVAAGRNAAVARQVEHHVKADEGPTHDESPYGTNPRDRMG